MEIQKNKQKKLVKQTSRDSFVTNDLATKKPPSSSFSSFSSCVLRWYRKHGRSLPWRDDLQQEKNPTARAYRAWIAETMLQQTTVATVLYRYRPFLKKFPTLDSLNAAPLESLLHAWQGLGYYARARRLHDAAKNIAIQGFPSDLSGWRALAGVGDYTASALTAFLAGESLVVMDTNIRRLYSRIFAENDERKRTELIKRLLPPRKCGDYTQALMDLGATICKAREPFCKACPVQRFCEAYRRDDIRNFPLRRAKLERPLRRATVVLLVRREGTRRFLLFRQSEKEGLLGGLSELPSSDFRKKNLCENWNSQKSWQKILTQLPMKTAKGRLLKGTNISHGFTHFRLHLRLVEAEAQEGAAQSELVPPYFWQEIDREGKFPTLALSTLMRKVLEGYRKSSLIEQRSCE